MTEIPNWIQERLEFDPTQDVQDEHIIEAFLEWGAPYMSRKQVELEVGLSDQQTRTRLRNLVERKILDSDSVANGEIYWIRDEKSDWPIPPDVDVEPASDEPTISELLNQLFVQYGVLGVLSTMLGSVLMTLFTLGLAYNLTIPIIQLSNLLLAGVLATVIGVVFISLGFGTWMIEKYTSHSIQGFFASE